MNYDYIIVIDSHYFAWCKVHLRHTISKENVLFLNVV